MNWQQSVLETFSDSTYLSKEEKCKNYGHTRILQALAPIPVTESSIGSSDSTWVGSGTGSSTGPGTGA